MDEVVNEMRKGSGATAKQLAMAYEQWARSKQQMYEAEARLSKYKAKKEAEEKEKKKEK